METMNLTCNICKNPNAICNCDTNSSWENFDKTIQDFCSGKADLFYKVNYTPLSISTMTVCFNFNKFIDLNLLRTKFSKNKTTDI